MRHYSIILSLLICSLGNTAQSRTDKLLKDVFAAEKDSLFQSVIQHPEIYRYQIIYTQINRDKNNTPSFTNYYFRYDSLQYFNPASTVKMPLAFLSLEKLNGLKQEGINM